MAIPLSNAVAETGSYLNIVLKLVQPDTSAATVTSVLQQIDGLTSTLLSSNDSSLAPDHLSNLWKSIFDEIIPRTAPPDQSKLVDFIVQLQKKKLVHPANGQEVKSNGEAVWTDLPSLGITLSDCWNHINLRDSNLSPESKQKWINQSGLLAQIFAIEFPFDLSIFALWTFREGLEENMPSNISIDTGVEAACWWFIYAADKLWACVQKYQEYENRRGMGGGGYYTKEWKGYNLERWAVWRQSLSQALNTSQNEGTKNLIQAALDRIKRVMPKE